MTIKGVTLATWEREGFAAPEADTALGDVRFTGANWVALPVTGYMDTETQVASIAELPPGQSREGRGYEVEDSSACSDGMPRRTRGGVRRPGQQARCSPDTRD